MKVKYTNSFRKVVKENQHSLTHRLGAASRIADQILVVDDGVVTECGSHDELLPKTVSILICFKAKRIGMMNKEHVQKNTTNMDYV